jgi:isopenicillin-N N-acyltransferase-like protein
LVEAPVFAFPMPISPDELPVLELSGSPEEIGVSHARAAGANIARCAAARWQLCLDFVPADGCPRPREAILSLLRDCLPAHEEFCPELMRELRAMAAESGASVEDLLLLNGFTDFKDLLHARDDGACTAFAITAELSANGVPWIGQTWDMNSTALPFTNLLRLRPEGLPEALMISLSGCVGMIGCNAAGLAVCTNNLHARHGRAGIFWPFLMRKILACRHEEEALDLLATVPLAGGHNFLLLGPSGTVHEWEILPQVRAKRPPQPWHAHTNHCLEPATKPYERLDLAIGRASSENRLAQAERFFQERRPPFGREDLETLTRCEDPEGIHHVCMSAVEGYEVQTCAAILMQPALGEVWALRGRPSEGTYRPFTVSA